VKLKQDKKQDKISEITLRTKGIRKYFFGVQLHSFTASQPRSEAECVVYFVFVPFRAWGEGEGPVERVVRTFEPSSSETQCYLLDSEQTGIYFIAMNTVCLSLSFGRTPSSCRANRANVHLF
jgi:hypothetical protein